MFAKIAPGMENGKGAVVWTYKWNRVGIYKFLVLRPINGISSPYWLLPLTRMPISRERAAKICLEQAVRKEVLISEPFYDLGCLR